MMKTLKVLGIDKAIKIVLSIVLAVSIITPLQHVYATTDGEEPVVTETTGTETTEVQNTADTQKVDEEQQIENPTETEVTYEVQNTEAPVTSEVPENTEVPAPTGTTEPTETPVSTEPAETTGTEGNSTEVLEPEVTEVTEEADADLMPEISYNNTVSGINVSIFAPEGAFPNGTTVVVTPISEDEALRLAEKTIDAETEKVTSAIAVDITFYYEGNEIQPLLPIEVSMSKALEGEEFNVYHVDENENVELVTEDATEAGAIFEAENFSIYLVTGKTKKYTTYKFYVNETEVSSQIVKTGDKLYAPVTPNEDGYKFVGWYDESDVEYTDFNTALTVTEDKEVKLIAKFEQAHYVFFASENGTIYHTESVAIDTEITLADYGDSFIPKTASQAVTGWYLEKELTNKVEKLTISNADVTVYAKVEEGSWLSFNTDGGSYIAPVFYLPDATTTAPTAPTKTGYTFAGWVLDDSGFEFGGKLSGNITIKATWEANQNTKYTVIFWQQKVTDAKDAKDEEKQYDYVSMEIRRAKTGSTVSPTLDDKNKVNSDSNYKGFAYNSTNSESVEVLADGSTVLNVRYDRQLMTINWHDGYCQLTWGGYTCSGKVTKQYTGLYEASFSSTNQNYTWPTDYVWCYKKSNGVTPLTFLSNFINPNSGDAATLEMYKYDDIGSVSYNFYKQNIDGSYPTTPSNTAYLESNSGFTFTNKYDGFTVAGYKTNSNSPGSMVNVSVGDKVNTTYKSLHIYFSRNSYRIDYNNGEKIVDTKSAKYEAPLTKSTYDIAEPERPSYVASEYVFAGWYADPVCKTKFNFDNAVMPANNIVLYAKWAAPEVSAKAYLTINGDDFQKIEVEYGKKIDEATMPVINDTATEKFAGWATRTGSDPNYTYYPFNFDTIVTGDIELYPQFVSKVTFSITYDSNKASVTSPVDNNVYAKYSWARVASPSVRETDDTVFLYWCTENGAKYYPGDRIKVTSDIKLTGVWGEKEKATFLTYDSNNDSGSSYTVNNIENNSIITLLNISNENLGYEKDGYYFVGWNTKKDATTAEFNANDSVRIDDINENVLYAIWNQKHKITVEANSDTFTYDGVSHSVSGLKKTTFEIDGKTYTVSGLEAEKSEINAGAYPVNVAGTAVVTDKDGKDATERFTIKTIPGSLTINKREVTVTGDGWTSDQPFTGSAYSTDEYTFDNVVSGHTATITYSLSGTEVNNYTGTFGEDFKVMAGDTDVTANYDLTAKTPGTLTIVKSEIAKYVTLTPTDVVKTYDGNTYTAGLAKAVDKNGKTVKIEYSVNGTDWTEDPTTITATNVADSKTVQVRASVASSYEGYVTGTQALTINKREVILKSESASKVFDDDYLTRPVVDITGDGFVTGEVTDIRATGSIKEVGNVTNTIEYTEQEGFDESNYNIEINEGTLEITPKSIVPEPEDPNNPDGTEYNIDVLGPEDTVYNGKVQEQKPFVTDNETGNELVEGTDYVLVYSEDTKNAGLVTVTVKGIGNYTDEFELEYEITPAPIKVTTGGASKTEDGKPLTNDEITVEGIVEGETYEAKTTGSQTSVGTSDNTYEIVWATEDNEYTALESNYEITEEELGTLTVNAAPVTPGEVDPEPTPTPSPRPYVPNPIVTPDVEPTETPEVTPTPTTTPEVIVEPETPQAARDNSWALLNLICSAGTVLLGLVLLISKTKKEEEEDEDEQKGFANEDDEANHYKRNKLYRLLGVITAVASVLVFIFTEDMRAKMVIIDRWTLLMVVLLFVNVVTFYLGRRWQEDEDEEEVQQ